MAVKVYSAAIGIESFKGSTIHEAWRKCTEMFRNPHASSYMRGHWPLDYLDEWGNNRESVGSIYRCVTGTGGIRFVKLIASEPPYSFSYVSAYLESYKTERNIFILRDKIDECPAQKRMDFQFERRGAETVATIKRREKGEVSWWEDLTDKLGDLAAINLSFILTGRNGIASNVQRVDSLRTPF